MVHARRRFRFTIGQGMLVIALLAVLFASTPMPIAIDVVFATTCLFIIGRDRLFIEPIGCICCFLGLLTGPAAFLAWLLRPSTADTDLQAFFIVNGALIIGGLGAARLRRRQTIVKTLTPTPDETQSELRRVAYLLKRAQKDGDGFVISKLIAYRAKLENELKERTSDQRYTEDDAIDSEDDE